MDTDRDPMDYATDNFQEIPGELDAPRRMKSGLIVLKMMTENPDLKKVSKLFEVEYNTIKADSLLAFKCFNCQFSIAFCLQQLDDLTASLPSLLTVYQMMRGSRIYDDPVLEHLRLVDYTLRNRARQIEIKILVAKGK